MKTQWVTFVCLTLFGCESEDPEYVPQFPPDLRCGLMVELTGALTVNLTGPGDPSRSGCAEQSIPSEIEVHFAPRHPTLARFGIRIPGEVGVTTGKQLAASVELETMGGTWRSSGCTVDLLENRLMQTTEFGDDHRLLGVGRCNAPAEPSFQGGPAVEIGPFEFQITENLENP